MKKKYLLTTVLLLCCILFTPGLTQAATKVKLSKTKATVEVGKSQTIKLLNNKKSVKWFISNSNAYITKKTKKYAVVYGLKSGKTKLTAQVGKKKYYCNITIKAKKTAVKKDDNKTDDTKVPTDNPEVKKSFVNKFSVEPAEVYNGNDVSISISNAEIADDGVNFTFICVNNSSKDYDISAHEYAINDLMAGEHLYGSDVSVPAGKKGKFSISVKKEWFTSNKITDIKKIDILYWGYYDNFKEWQSEKVTIYTDLNDGKYYSPTGKEIYSDENLSLYHIGGYKFCLYNKSNYEHDWTIDDCTINEWSYELTNYTYDLFNEPILGESYTTFEIPIDDGFLKEYGITKVNNIEFDIEFDYDIKTDKIKFTV